MSQLGDCVRRASKLGEREVLEGLERNTSADGHEPNAGCQTCQCRTSRLECVRVRQRKLGASQWKKRWCSACGQRFVPRAQCPRQTYCAKAACQKARKLLWQTTKRHSDHDYYENQAKANKAWIKRNALYWVHRRSKRAERSVEEFGSLIAAAVHRMLDASSLSSPHRERPVLRFVFQFSIGEDEPLAIKLRVEVKPSEKKSSSPRSQETT